MFVYAHVYLYMYTYTLTYVITNDIILKWLYYRLLYNHMDTLLHTDTKTVNWKQNIGCYLKLTLLKK